MDCSLSEGTIDFNGVDAPPSPPMAACLPIRDNFRGRAPLRPAASISALEEQLREHEAVKSELADVKARLHSIQLQQLQVAHVYASKQAIQDELARITSQIPELTQLMVEAKAAMTASSAVSMHTLSEE